MPGAQASQLEVFKIEQPGVVVLSMMGEVAVTISLTVVAVTFSITVVAVRAGVRVV